jgi:hypothetical protein
VTRRTIQIPHLNYTVKLRPIKPMPNGDVPRGAWVHHVNDWNSTIYVHPNPTPSVVAHEVTHILQHICSVRHIDFIRETEHMGYISQYLVMRAMGNDWHRP